MDRSRSGKSILSYTFFLPMIAAAVLVVAFLVYYFPVASRQEASLNDRAFRTLSATGRQIQIRTGSYKTAVAQVAKRLPPPDKVGKLDEDAARAYLADQVPELTPGKCLPGTQSELGRVDAVASGRGYSLRFYYSSQSEKKDKQELCPVDLSLRALMAPLLSGVPESLFDEIILADPQGRVLFGTRKTGAVVNDVSGLFQQQGPRSDDSEKDKKKNPAGKSEAETQQPVTFEMASKSSNLASVALAGRNYRLYLVPVPLMWEPGDSLRGQTHTSDRTQLVLCGLVEQGRLRADSLAVSETALITGVLALLLVMVGAWPWLKFNTMSATEEIPRRAGLTFVLTTLVAIALMVMLVVHVGYLVGPTEVDSNLELLARAIDRHVGDELIAGLGMMDTVMSTHRFQEDEGKVHLFYPREATCRTQIKETHDPPVNDASILNSTEFQFGAYPYFNVLFWSDRQGFQQIRYSVDEQKNPGLRVCERPYFDGVMHDDVWYLKDEEKQERRHRFRVDPLYSRQNGEYVAVVSESVSDRTGKSQSILSVASMATPLLSLIHPVLPANYDFAVINPDGNVLFHSNSSKNGTENFFDESGGNPELRAAVFSRLGEHLTFDYEGVSHEAFVTPFGSIQRCPWTLVVFSRLSTFAAQRIERIWFFAILTLAYYGAFLLITLFLVRLQDYPFPWIWPQTSRSGTYRHIGLAVGIIALPFAWLIFKSRSWDVLGAVIVIPAATVVVVLLKLKSREQMICWIAAGLWILALPPLLIGLEKENWWQLFQPLSYISAGYAFLSLQSVTEWLNRLKTPRLPTSFAFAFLCLLLLVGIMPCIAFFKVAYDCEEDLSTRREQLLTIAALQQREQRVKRQYLNVDLSGAVGSSAVIGKWLFQRRRLDQMLDRYDNVFVDQNVGQIFSPGYGMALVGKGPGEKRGEEDMKEPEKRNLTCEKDPLEPLLRLSSWIPKSGIPMTRQFGESPAKQAQWSWCAEGINRLRLHCYSECQVEETSDASSPQTIALSRFVRRDPLYLSQELVFELENLKPDRFLRKLGLTFLVLIAVIFFWLRSTLRKIFLLDVDLGNPWPALDTLDDLPKSKDLILLREVWSEEVSALAQCTDEFYSVNLVTTSQTGTIDWESVAQPAVILDHFEIGLDVRETRRRKRQLLERLIFGCHNRKAVVIVSTIDLQFYVENASQLTKARELDAWGAVLAGFSLVRLKDETPSEKESYYRALWSTSTWNEQLALHQLAKTGWANHKNQVALRHLFLRGIIVRNPVFMFTDEGFRRFVAGRTESDDRRQWHVGESGNVWEGLRIMFLVILGGVVATVLFFNQQDILAYITTGISVFTPVSKLLANVRGTTKGKSEEA
jgi:hypothetical protein